MKVTFQIDYHTGWGESMHVIGSLPCLSEGQAMTATPDGMQTVTVEISPAQGVFDYGYEVHRDYGTVRREWGHRRRLRLDSHLTSVLVHDHWKETPSDKPFYSSAFTEAIFRHERGNHIRSTKAATLEIKVDAPEVPAEAVVAIAGGCEALGFWDPQHARVLEPVEAPEWRITLPMESLPDRFEFKFLLLRKSDRSILAWERSDNRVFNRPTLGANGAMIIAGLYLESPMEKWRGSGTAIPVFALRSEQGFGTGEFADIRKMVDWAVATGQQFIQLLPINDTTMTHTWTDSYPYTTNSTFALHPMYLRLEDVGSLPSPELKEEYDRLREELNQLPTLDYERVNAAKLRLSRILFDSQGEAEMTSRAFQEFAVRNDGWLTPYAVWCVLRDRFGTPDMDLWGEYARCTDAVIERVTTENRKDVDYFRFIQYHLDKQLRQACDYAHEHGVVLKGDIPIGISRCSVDAWRYPELFNFTCTAGAPPDDFATFGQNWGFPTYRWDVMARDGYKWWRERLMKMAEYFSAYRIDHLLGFFRIWQIPADTLHGLLGVFCPALPLSPEEMSERYGFAPDLPLHITPYITDAIIERKFGADAETVRRDYLTLTAPSRHALRKGMASQVAIASHFATAEKNESSDRICQGLMDLLDDVLLIEDPYQPGRYHPRIDASKTEIYRTLSDGQRKCFDRMYEDFFYHRHNDFWREKALEKLPPLIDSTGMLACAEDLGMIPACVPEVMAQLQILSLEIQRMPKEYGVATGIPDHYPYLSVCSTSTHDMPGLRQWWHDDRDRARKLYETLPHDDGDAPLTATPEVCRLIVEQNLAAPSMLCILPLQDWLSMDGKLRRNNPEEEQINIPADPHHYWRYRMHLTLEELLEATGLNDMIARCLNHTGRRQH